MLREQIKSAIITEIRRQSHDKHNLFGLNLGREMPKRDGRQSIDGWIDINALSDAIVKAVMAATGSSDAEKL